MQLPQVVIFTCGLGTYWLIDEWVCREVWAVFSTSGVSRRRLTVAVLAPGMVMALWMLVFNVTAFRKAIGDAGRELAVVQLEDAGRAMARAGVLQVGPLRVLARSAEGPRLHDALASLDTFAAEATDARFADDTLRAEGLTLLMLEPPARITAQRAQLTLPGAAPWAWGARLQSDARGSSKALALALGIPASMLAAVLCASLGLRLGRLRAFMLWSTLGFGALFLINAALAPSDWWLYQPLGPIAVFFGWALAFTRVREA
jgi:hypothetical protein